MYNLVRLRMQIKTRPGEQCVGIILAQTLFKPKLIELEPGISVNYKGRFSRCAVNVDVPCLEVGDLYAMVFRDERTGEGDERVSIVTIAGVTDPWAAKMFEDLPVDAITLQLVDARLRSTAR